jgi:hypothetical protein
MLELYSNFVVFLIGQEEEVVSLGRQSTAVGFLRGLPVFFALRQFALPTFSD